MGKNKLVRFAENATFQHVVQPPFKELVSGRFPLRGAWSAVHFKREAPLVLELGCGKGEYTIGLARLHPGMDHVGVDIKGSRIWRGAVTAKEEGLSNVAFLRTHVDHIEHCFAPGEVSEIWLTFSDPQLGKPRKRLTSPLFVDRYRNILRPGGTVNLKTDSPDLYAYTLEQVEEHGHTLLESSDDVHGELMGRISPEMQAILAIRTFYEARWLKEGRKIHYARFTLAGN